MERCLSIASFSIIFNHSFYTLLMKGSIFHNLFFSGFDTCRDLIVDAVFGVENLS